MKRSLNALHFAQVDNNSHQVHVRQDAIDTLCGSMILNSRKADNLPAMMFAYCIVADGSSKFTTACMQPDLPVNG